MTQKTLRELFSEKALSLMGDRRIKLLHSPDTCNEGEIVGVGRYNNGQGFWYLEVTMNNGNKINIPVQNYLENFIYNRPDGDIKTTLSAAGRETVRAPRPYATKLENFDVIRNDKEFQVASRIAPSYVKWELIKNAEHVLVLNKLMTSTSEDYDLFCIEAETARGAYRTAVRLDQLSMDASDAEALPYDPVSAIGIAEELYRHWFSLKEPGVSNRIFAELDEDEIDTHYMVVFARTINSKDEYTLKSCYFLDDRLNRTRDHNQSVVIPYSGKETADLEKEWRAFLDGHANPYFDLMKDSSYEIRIAPASHFADEPTQKMH